MEKLYWILCLFGVLLVVGSKPHSVEAAATGEEEFYADDEDDGDGEDVDFSKLNPTIEDTSQIHHTEVGGRVDFLCRGKDLDHFTILWSRIRSNEPTKKADYLNTGIIINDPRFSINDKGTVLTLNIVKASDDGVYTCLVAGATKNTSLSHTLRVKGVVSSQPDKPPMVSTHPHIYVGAGNSTQLRCNASGSPDPKVYWEKKNDRMPNGQLVNEGRVITFQIVSRRHAGIYECMANNSLGAARTALNLTVIYAPEIEIGQDSINAGLNSHVELACTVYAEPIAKVEWIKDSITIPFHSLSGKYHQQSVGNKHLLHVKDIAKQDYGSYACVAKNTQGVSTETIDLSGSPSQPIIKEGGVGTDGKSYRLVYKMDSAAPVSEFRLKYKKVGEDDVEVPVEGNLDEGTTNKYTVDHILKDLESSADYEVTLSAKNEFGWSKEARPRRFHINGGSSGASRNCMSLSTSSLIASIIIFLSLFRIRWQ